MERFIQAAYLHSNKGDIEDKAQNLGLNINKLEDEIEYTWYTITIDLTKIVSVRVMIDGNDAELAMVDLINGSSYVLNILHEDLIEMLDDNIGNVIRMVIEPKEDEPTESK